jgi:hypothetical protein
MSGVDGEATLLDDARPPIMPPLWEQPVPHYIRWAAG